MKAFTLIRIAAAGLLLVSSVATWAGPPTNIQLVGSIVPVQGVQPISVVSASASSGQSGEYGADKAIDGDGTTRWGSAFDQPEWITFDLGAAYALSSIVIDWEAANAESYEMRGSNDNNTWVTLAAESGGSFGDRTDTVSLSGTYRYLRMYGINRSSQYGFSIWEVTVYGEGTLTNDADNDGVADSVDQCPATPANTAVESDGCPIGQYGGYDAPTSYPGYSLVWSDEFNGTSLNTSDWTSEIGTGSGGWGNNELQYYRSQNTTVGNGFLTIEARKENFGGKQYTSSRLKTQGKQSFQYGRIDVRAVLPEGQGLWPAIWLLGDSISSVSWPACGEIDMMELRGNEPDTVSGTAHWQQNPGDGFSSYYSSDQAGTSPQLSSGTFADNWHVFSIVWDASEIKWYLDGASSPFHVIDITPNQLSEFRSSFFLLLNVAVGGNFLPNPPSNPNYFPQRMLVDYVRVYQ